MTKFKSVQDSEKSVGYSDQNVVEHLFVIIILAQTLESLIVCDEQLFWLKTEQQ